MDGYVIGGGCVRLQIMGIVVVSMLLDRYGISAGLVLVWDHCEIRVGSVWDQCWISVGSAWDQRGISQCGISAGSVWDK